MRTSLTIDLAYEGRIVLAIALELYLRQFTDNDIKTAHPSSAITEARRTLNRLHNIGNGCDVEYDLNYFPHLGNGVTVTEWRDRNGG